MKQLFDKLSIRVSRLTTRMYSTSFSMGIYFIDGKLRDAIYAIYGFVRLADEIVDSFDGFQQRDLLNRIREETFTAIHTGISINPILNSFQGTVNKYDIDHNLIGTFLQSMEMDLDTTSHSQTSYERYVLGSAEVVGLMCLHVFTEGDRLQFDELKPAAMKLGAAFQKVNFLRDIREDYRVLGRVYFPGVDISGFDCSIKKEIEQDIERDFAEALHGIRRLPSTCRTGVYLAYVYYRNLFEKIKRLPADRLFIERIRINNRRKIGLMINCVVQNKMNWV